MKVVLASSDLVTAYGAGMAPLWAGLLAGRTAIDQFDWFNERNFTSRMAGVVPGMAAKDAEPRLRRLLWPLLAPLRNALPPATPLLLATTVGEVELLERAVLGEGDSAEAARPDRLLLAIQAWLGLTGPAQVVSAACASGALALARAAALVAGGKAEAVLVVAADAVSELVYSGFSSLLALSSTPARPFDRDRDGLTIGEAAAWALVTHERNHLPARLGAPQAIIAGWGCANDASHMTAPSRDGAGLRLAMDKALAPSGLKPTAVDFICAHGTGTAYNDAMEAEAFRRFFPAPRPFFSVKGGTGHTMGAAGLVELLVTAAALRHGVIPPTVGLQHPEPGFSDWLSAVPVAAPQATYALSTNSGFGGINTAVMLAQAGVSS